LRQIQKGFQGDIEYNRVGSSARSQGTVSQSIPISSPKEIFWPLKMFRRARFNQDQFSPRKFDYFGRKVRTSSSSTQEQTSQQQTINN
jgi:hypothetical protein